MEEDVNKKESHDVSNIDKMPEFEQNEAPKLGLFEKMYLRSAIGKIRKRLVRNKAEKNRMKYMENIDKAKKAIIELMELVEIEKEVGGIYQPADIMVLDPDKAEKLFEEVLNEFGKMVR